jgi:nitrite reductase/ring-hydroxylating ferredoxin subunit
MAWTDVIDLQSLEAKGKTVVRHEGRQILLIHSSAGVFACANRCPAAAY